MDAHRGKNENERSHDGHGDRAKAKRGRRRPRTSSIAAAAPPAAATLLLPLLLLASRCAAQRAPTDDFAAWNALVYPANAYMAEEINVRAAGVKLDLRNVECTHWSVDDVRISAAQFEIINLDCTCRSRYKYTGWFGDINRGDIEIRTRGSDVKLNLQLGPDSLKVSDCVADVGIEDIDIDKGGIVGWFGNAIERSFRSSFERTARQAVCRELESQLPARGSELLQSVSTSLGGYADAEATPLADETKWNGTDPRFGDDDFLNWQYPKTRLGDWLRNALLPQTIEYLTKTLNLPNDRLPVWNDIRANVLIREQLSPLARGQLPTQSGNRALDIDLSSDDGSPSTYLLDYEDNLIRATARVDKIKINGLDTLTTIEPLNPVGAYTLRNSIGWRFLQVRAYLSLDIVPSTKPNALITGGSIREQITLTTRLDGLGATAGALAAVNESILHKIVLGSLVESAETLRGCLLASVADSLRVSELRAGARAVPVPLTLDGFVSPGLDRVFGSSTDVILEVFERQLLAAAPAWLDGAVRPLVNDNFVRPLLASNAIRDATCNSWSGPAGDATVDLRDLLLSPDRAAAAGGSGDQPYGTVISTLLTTTVQQQFQSGDVNESIIRPLTKAQSNREGVLVLTDPIIEFVDSNGSDEDNKNITAQRKSNLGATGAAISKALWYELSFSVSNIQVNNLDSVVPPFSLFEPTDANRLTNRIEMNPGNGKNINSQARIKLEIVGSPLRMNNAIDVQLSLPSAGLSADLVASLRQQDFFNLPLGDVTNPHCWLAALDDSDLALENLAVALPEIIVDAVCSQCSSPGSDAIPNIMRSLNSGGLSQLMSGRIETLLRDVIWTYWESLDVVQLQNDAPKRCPHRPEYDPNMSAVKDGLKWKETTVLPEDSIETVVSMVILFFQSSLFVVSQNQLLVSGINGENDRALEARSYDAAVVDWTNLVDIIGPNAESAFRQATDYVNEVIEDGDAGIGSQATIPRLTKLLRSSLSDTDGIFTVNFTDYNFEGPGFNVSIATVEILGLESLDKAQVLNITGPQTIRNTLHFETLELRMGLDIAASADRTERMTVVYSFEDVDMEVDILLALNLDKLGDIELGRVMQTKNVFPCVMGSVDDLQFDNLIFKVASMGKPQFAGFFDPDFDQQFARILDILNESYLDGLAAALPQMTNSTLREIANRILPIFLGSWSEECKSSSTVSSSDTLIDFRDLLLSSAQSIALGGEGLYRHGDLFPSLFESIRENFLQSEAINDYLSSWTESQTGAVGLYKMIGNFVDTNATFTLAGLVADATLLVSNVSMANIHTFGDPLELLLPLANEPQLLGNSLAIGELNEPLGLATNIQFELSDGNEMQIRNSIDVRLSIEFIELAAELLLQITEGALSSFPLRDLTNTDCWLSTILGSTELNNDNRLRGFSLVNYTLAIGNVTLDIDCVECSSPEIDSLLRALYQKDGTAEPGSFVRDYLDRILDGNFLQSLLDTVADRSSKQCPHNPAYDPEANDSEISLATSQLLELERLVKEFDEKKYVNIANSVLAGALLLFGIICAIAVRRRNKKWVASLSDDGARLFERQQEKERARDQFLNETTTSLFKSQHLTRRVRYAVPLGILLNLGLYLGGHLGVLSTVNVDATLAGESFTLHRFMQFRFISATTNTYKNGGSEMAVLMWITAGILPYVKLLFSLALWMLPPNRVSVSLRGRLYLWIDVLAKLSVIDIATVVLGVSLLLIFIGGPYDGGDNGEGQLYTAKAIIIPGFGFYCVISAQRLSRVSSRFFLECHDRVVEAASSFDKKQDDDFDEEIAKGSDESDESDHGSHIDRESSKTHCFSTDTTLGRIGLGFAGVTVFAIVLVGCFFAPSIAIDTSDILQLALESGNSFEESVSKYGVFSLVIAVLVKTRFVLDTRVDYVGLGILLVLGIVSVGALFFLQVTQFIKNRIENRRKAKEAEAKAIMRSMSSTSITLGTPECGLPYYLRLYKWRHMEIFIISVAVGIWQLGSVASFIFYTYCDIIGTAYEVLGWVGIVQSSNAQCFRTQLTKPDNLSIIFASLFVLLLVFAFQARGQSIKNVADVMATISEDDAHDMSLAWTKSASASFQANTEMSSSPPPKLFSYNPELDEIPSSNEDGDISNSEHPSESDDEHDSPAILGISPRPSPVKNHSSSAIPWSEDDDDDSSTRSSTDPTLS